MQRKMSEKDTFYSRLLGELDRQGKTQQDLAVGIGTAVSTVYRWKGGNLPQRRTVNEVCNFLGVEMDWLLRGEGEREALPLHSQKRLAEPRPEKDLDAVNEPPSQYSAPVKKAPNVVSDDELLDSMFALMGQFGELRRRLKSKDQRIERLQVEVEHLQKRLKEEIQT
jgi:transcriptional regulator with XRE-family HTH domain